MKKPSLIRQILTGIVLGLLITPAQPIQAQWTVYDPANHATQIERMIQDGVRWIETIDKYRKDIEHYTQMFDKAVEQVTKLRGIMSIVDEQLAKQKNLIRLTSDVGQIIRGSIRLKKQLEAMVTYRIRALRQIDDRLRRGIFNPEADMRDFEEYLTYSIGRNSQETVAKMERLAKADTQLGEWYVRQQQVQVELATANQQLSDAEQQLDAEKAKSAPEQAAIQHLNDVILQISNRISELEQELAELKEKIAARVAQYGLYIEDLEKFGFQVIAVKDTWTSLNETHDQIARTIDELISGGVR